MNLLLYYFVRTFIVLLQMLPLNCVARIGRFFGGLFYCLDARHRRVARRNLTMCFGAEKSPAEIRALALESFKRIGENFVCPIKLVSVPPGQLWERLTLVGGEKLHAHNKKDPAPSIILAIGHFGCFELFA